MGARLKYSNIIMFEIKKDVAKIKRERERERELKEIKK